MAKVYVGLDLGSSQFQLATMNADGEILMQRSCQTTEHNLQLAFRHLRNELKGEIQVHLEAGELAAWVRELITPFVNLVVISDPRQNAWIAKDPNKSDRVDSLKLADLLRMNRIHEVYCDQDSARRLFKQIVQHYQDLTEEQARLKVKIKARLRNQGVICRGQRLFTTTGAQSVLDQLPSRQAREMMEQLYQLLAAARAQRLAALKTMRQMSTQFPEIKILMTVPGVKLINACRFSAYVQNPHRFPNLRKFWRYSRLGVAYRSSDGKPLGRAHLDNTGLGVLKDISRKAFEASMRRQDDNLFKRAYRESFARTHNATHARLSVQRKILAVMRSMWIHNEPFRDPLG